MSVCDIGLWGRSPVGMDAGPETERPPRGGPVAATTRAGKAVWPSAMDTPVGAFLGPNWVRETTTIKMHAAPRPARPVIGPRSVKDGLVNLSGNVRDQLDEPAVVAIGRSISSLRQGVSHPHHRERNPKSSPSPWEPNILSTSPRRGWSWPTALSSFRALQPQSTLRPRSSMAHAGRPVTAWPAKTNCGGRSPPRRDAPAASKRPSRADSPSEPRNRS